MSVGTRHDGTAGACQRFCTTLKFKSSHAKSAKVSDKIPRKRAGSARYIAHISAADGLRQMCYTTLASSGSSNAVLKDVCLWGAERPRKWRNDLVRKFGGDECVWADVRILWVFWVSWLGAKRRSKRDDGRGEE